VLWSQALGPITAGDEKSLQQLVVRLKDLTTGTVTTLATKAGQSLISWPWAAWGQITSGAGGYVTLKNLVTGQERNLQQQPRYLALSEANLAYTDEQAVYLLEDITQETVAPVRLATAANEADHLEFVSLSDRLVGWRHDFAQPVVWDRREQRVGGLPPPEPGGPAGEWGGGGGVPWVGPGPRGQPGQGEGHNLLTRPPPNRLATTPV